MAAAGTFVALRGGNEYSALVRKTEPKPLRIFLEDGSTDTPTPVFGNWFEANQSLEASLTYAGYDVQHVWGEHGHDGKPGGYIFPDVLRWLWKDWPTPVKAGWSSNSMLKDILLPDEGWQLVSESPGHPGALAVNGKGEAFFSDTKANTIYKIGADGKAVPFAKKVPGLEAAAFGPDGVMYGVTKEDKKVIAIDPSGAVKTIASGIHGGGLVDFNFSNSFNQAIEAKVTTEQNALAAKNLLAQKEYEAQRVVATARGKAEAMSIESAALAKNPQVLSLRALEKWDGALPRVTTGAIPFIDMKSFSEAR